MSEIISAYTLHSKANASKLGNHFNQSLKAGGIKQNLRAI